MERGPQDQGVLCLFFSPPILPTQILAKGKKREGEKNKMGACVLCVHILLSSMVLLFSLFLFCPLFDRISKGMSEGESIHG